MNTNVLWTVSVSISIITMFFCLIMGYKILTTPISINDHQMAQIVEAVRSSQNMEIKIDSLQMAQILSALEYGNKAKTKVEKKVRKSSGAMETHELINRYYEENQ